MTSAPDLVPPPPGMETCPLCGAPLAPTVLRCPECNLALDGMGARPAAFTRRSVGLWAVGLLVVYLVVLAVVVIAR